MTSQFIRVLCGLSSFCFQALFRSTDPSDGGYPSKFYAEMSYNIHKTAEFIALTRYCQKKVNWAYKWTRSVPNVNSPIFSSTVSTLLLYITQHVQAYWLSHYSAVISCSQLSPFLTCSNLKMREKDNLSPKFEVRISFWGHVFFFVHRPTSPTIFVRFFIKIYLSRKNHA